MDGELRPLGVWEIVEGGVRLFFRHWLAFMGAILLVIVPLQFIAAGVTWAVAPEQLEWNSSTSGGEDPDVLLWQGIVALIGFLTLLLVTAMSLNGLQGPSVPENRSPEHTLRRYLSGFCGAASGDEQIFGAEIRATKDTNRHWTV